MQLSSGFDMALAKQTFELQGKSLDPRAAHEAAASKNKEKIRQVAEEFESVFLTEMFSHMFKGIKPDNLFGGGHGEDIFNTLLVREYGNSVSKAGGIGLADSIERQLLALQEGRI